jgi:peroxiredoxin
VRKQPSARGKSVAVKTGDRAPEFDLEVTHAERVRLSDLLQHSNVLLVFHPFAFTQVCEDEARDLQENLESFRNAQTEIVFVSCDSAPARQAWKAQLGAQYTFASDFWPHGAAARAYDVFDEETGAAVRGTFLIAKDGTVIWSLVKPPGERRTELVPESLDTLEAA